MTRALLLSEQLRDRFWVLPALAIVLAVAAALTFTAVDGAVELPDAVSFSGSSDTARAVLQMVATIAVSVAGISFSVIVVALVLASQQLSPRVLRNFQRHPLNQTVLAVFLGTATFSIFVLAGLDDSGDEVPELAVTTAMLLSALSLGLFGYFLHHIVRSLNASAVIRRIAADGHRAVHSPYPEPLGRGAGGAGDVDLPAPGDRAEVRAPRAGYVASIDGERLLAAADELDGFVEQKRAIGEFTVTGGLLALVWCDEARRDDLVRAAADAFVLNEERLVDDDIAFPLRQLGDVALKGLSPGVNDPTTSENAMDSLTDTLVRLARQPEGDMVRAWKQGVPRFRARPPSLDALVRMGFDQVRRDGAARPSFAVRLLELLAELRECGGERARSCREIGRQAILIRDHAAAQAEIPADADLLREAYDRLHGGRSDGGFSADGHSGLAAGATSRRTRPDA